MGIREIWNTLEATMTRLGFPLTDTDDVSQPRRCTIRITEVPSEMPTRGTFASGVVRLVFSVQVVLIYEASGDKRVERKVAEDAEDAIHAIYTDVNLSNHHFLGAAIERDPARGLVTNTIRFDFQSQAVGG